LLWRAFTLLAVHLSETLLLLGSWACVGVGALAGRLDAGWLAAWALALGSTVPLHAASTWLQGAVALGFGGLLKQRLLVGAMALDPDLIRRKGAGEILSEVLETEAIGDLGASGGIATVLALLELLIAPSFFYWGAAFVPEAAILIVWVALILGLDRAQRAPARRLDRAAARVDQPAGRKHDGPPHPGCTAAARTLA
jgi:ATP-binding cassette, subfamily B, bacterial